MEHALQFSPTEGKRRNMQKEMYQISCKMEANVSSHHLADIKTENYRSNKRY
jgi:hypothetical protein